MDAVTSLAEALGLPASGQSWGIEHSDSSRLGEFLEFATSRQPAHPYEFELLAELIFQSVEEARESNVLTGELRDAFLDFVRTRKELVPQTFQHWRSNPDSDWCVPALLRASAEV